jgi:hypothetical protein
VHRGNAQGQKRGVNRIAAILIAAKTPDPVQADTSDHAGKQSGITFERQPVDFRGLFDFSPTVLGLLRFVSFFLDLPFSVLFRRRRSIVAHG